VDLVRTLQRHARVRFRFDAGTIVLEGATADLRGRSLPGMQWDDRIGAFRAPADAWPRIREVLVRDPGRVPDGVRAIGQIHEGWAAIALRPYQESAVLAWELASQRGLALLRPRDRRNKLGRAAEHGEPPPHILRAVFRDAQ
jgi:hypothetical protein